MITAHSNLPKSTQQEIDKQLDIINACKQLPKKYKSSLLKRVSGIVAKEEKGKAENKLKNLKL